MGAKESKERSFRQTSSSWSPSEYESASPSYGQAYPPQQPYTPQQAYPPQYTSGGSSDNRKRLERRYSRIADDYKSLEEVRLMLLKL